MSNMNWWGSVCGGNVNNIFGNQISGYGPYSQPGYPPRGQPGYPPYGQPSYPPMGQPGYPPMCQPMCQPNCQPVCGPMRCNALPPGDEAKDDKAASGRWKLIEDGTKIVSCEGPDVSISITYEEDGEKIIVFGAPKTASEDNKKWNFMTGRWKLIEGGAMIANCENPDFCIPIAYDRDEEIVTTGEPMRPSEDKRK